MKFNQYLTRILTFGVLLVAEKCCRPAPLEAGKYVNSEFAKQRATTFIGQNDVILAYEGLEEHKDWSAQYRPSYYKFTSSGKKHFFVRVNTTTGEIQSFSWQDRDDQKLKITAEQARSVATSFIEKHIAVSEREGWVPETTNFNDHAAGGKDYATTWSKIIKGIRYPFWTTVTVSASNGDVIAFRRVEHPVVIPDITPRVSKEDSLRLVLSKNTLDKGWVVSEQFLQITPVNPKQQLEWVAILKGYKTSQLYSQENGRWSIPYEGKGYVDALTGVLDGYGEHEDLTRKPIMVEAPLPQPKTYSALADWPQWSAASDDTFLFSHLRYMEPDFKARDDGDSVPGPNGYKGVVSIIKNGQETELLWTPQVVAHPSWALQNTKRIAFESWISGGINLIALNHNWLHPLSDNHGELGREMPCWDSTGQLLTFAGAHSPGDGIRTDGETDIFVSGMVERFNTLFQDTFHCIETLSGRDVLPTFNPDNKTVVFANQKFVSANVDHWVLFRARSDNDYINTPAKAIAPEQIAVLPMEPERLSWFPDGNRVLVSYPNDQFSLKNKPEIIDLTTKQRIKFEFPKLHDPDFPKGQTLIPNTIAVSPSGKKMAFSARRWSGDPKDSASQCIYSCDLNGSALKRITSPTKTNVKKYRFSTKADAVNAWEAVRFDPAKVHPKSSYEQWMRDHKPKPAPDATAPALTAPKPPKKPNTKSAPQWKAN